jgi:protein-S-isoprenylcysteine O-methyltransferase Ste14
MPPMTSAHALGLVALAVILADLGLWVHILSTPTAKRPAQVTIAIAVLVVVPLILISMQHPSLQSVAVPVWQIVSGWAILVLGGGVLLYQIVQAAPARRRPPSAQSNG